MMSSQELSPLFLTGFARGKNVIAVDADDVLVSTNKKVAERKPTGSIHQEVPSTLTNEHIRSFLLS
jgi:hypothetical protein